MNNEKTMLNWREIPFVRLLFPFLIGVFLAHCFSLKLFFLYPVLIVLALVLLLPIMSKISFTNRWQYGILLNCFLLISAYQWTIYHNQQYAPSYFGQALANENIFTGNILDLQEKGERFRAILDIQSIGKDHQQQNTCEGQMLVYFPIDSLTRQLQFGDLLLIKSQIKTIAPPQNPHAFDFQQYWRSQNIYEQCFVRANQWQLLARDRGHPILAQAFALRSRLLSILKKHLPTENEYAVAAALILGNKEHLTSDLRNAYAGTGAMHVLAVSGLHVGLIYLGLAFLLRWIRSRHPYWASIRVLLLLLGVWSFALLTGASASVMRAAAMFSFVIVGQAMKHHPSIYNTLAASAFCLLLWNPFLLLNVGFQLSYLAVLGIVYFQAKIYKLWIIDLPIGDYLWKMVSVALAAQMVTFPISLYYFHQFPIYFWLSGLVVVPAAMLVLASGILLFLTAPLAPFLAVGVATILYWTVWLMNALVFLIHQIPAAIIPGIWIGLFALLILYLLLVNVVLAINLRQVRWVRYGLCCLIVLAIGQVYKNGRQVQQKEIVFYKMYNNSVIDLVDGQQSITLSETKLQSKDLAFISQNHHWALGLRQQQSILLTSPKLQSGNWYYENGFVQFYEQTIGIFRGQAKTSNSAKIHLDFVYLCPDARWTISDLQKQFTFKKVIFAASARRKYVNQLIKECEAAQLDYHDLNQSGALIVSL